MAAAVVALCALTPAASAQVEPYGTDDYGGFHNILPPGQCQTVNGQELADFFTNGDIPAHCDDQRAMYQDLIHATPGLTPAQIDDFYKDGSFGVKPADVASGSPYHPGGRAGLTVIRDNGFGVPHVYGQTRADVMFGAGYVGAEDRLFFMDVLRHSGRAQLSEFAGASNRAMDAEQWEVAPYKEQDLQKQYDLADEVYGPEGAQLQQDVDNYIAGINQYIGEARLDPDKMPGEYAAILKPSGPTDWKVTDVIATASLIGGIFGKGGGGEVGNAEVLNSAIAKFGGSSGTKVWQDFRRANDPEANTTVHDQSFPYQDRPGTDPFNNPAVAIQDPGTLQDGSPDDATSGGGGLLGGLLGPLGGLSGASNALLVSANESASGHPEVVFGPQVAYFAPEILMEEDLHGPDIDARGATFVGVNLYVLLGRGQDFAWSATSAGQDIIDTFAEKLCEPDGADPGTEPDPGTIDSMRYLWKGECRPMEVLTRDQVITPNPGDPGTPETLGPYHLEAQRTVHGIVSKRATVNGQPVAFAKLRSTYFHEADSARAFSALNQPSKVQSASDFQNVMSKINFTFNWFYADDKDITYFNSGNNPVRAPGTDPEFPTWGTGPYDWQGWDPVTNPNSSTLAGGTNIAQYTPFSEHPKVTNQNYISSWNNKQAPGYRAAEDNYYYGPVHRVQSLDERIQAGIAGSNTMSLPEVIDAMEDGGSVDLRASQALPLMLDVIEQGTGGVPGGLQADVDLLRDWIASGAHRRDRDSTGTYDNSRAVAIMDAWWDKALTEAFKPHLGDPLFNAIEAQMPFDDPPSLHLGSAYFEGWEGYLSKDLRSLLGQSPSDPFSRAYCGGTAVAQGNLDACRAVLVSSLQDAIAVVNGPNQYPDPESRCPMAEPQMCFDTIQFRTVGGVAIDDIEWINRPTWQQAVEVQSHRPASGTGGGGNGGGSGTGSSGGATTGNPGTFPGFLGKKCRKGKKGKKTAQAAKRRCGKKKKG